MHRDSPVVCEAVRLGGGDRLALGALVFEVMETPGHTPESISLLLGDKVFTGDALLVGTCGRTDFQGGDAGALFDSIHAHLLTLPDATLVYPAHDYHGRTQFDHRRREARQHAAQRQEPRPVRRSLMNSLGLPPPKKIDVALEANLGCGRPSQAHSLAAGEAHSLAAGEAHSLAAGEAQRPRPGPTKPGGPDR